MHSNNFNHLCVKSALRTVGPGRDKSCQLYLNTGSCRPPKNMKGMDSDKGGTAVSYTHLKLPTTPYE